MDLLRFALLGLATGALYAMVAQGMVLVYRGSGLLNFAQSGLVMVGAYAYFESHNRAGFATAPSLVLAIAVCALLGAAINLAILRPMRQSSPLARVIATLGVLIVLYSVAVLRYQHDLRSIPSILPTRTVTVLPGISLGLDRILIFAIGCLLTLVLWAVYRFTSFGRVTTAVAQNEICAATLGHSPDRIATINWAVGGGVAGLAGVLIAPITFLEPDTLSIQLLVFPLAAALVAGFGSFPVTLLAALGIGIGQAELGRYVSLTGIQSAAPFLVVIFVLVVRGQGLPLRGTLLDRLPAVGTGRVRPILTVVLYAAAAAVVFSVDVDWATAISVTVISAIICLSVVVITGYGGQLSLAQFVLAGVAALVAARLSPHVPFVLALVVAVVVTMLVGFVIGLPAMRTRGITLAIVTLGLAVTVYAVVLSHSDWTGGQSGLTVRTPSLFGWDIDPFFNSGGYAFVALTALVLLALATANLRRGAVGRRLLAVRSNERAAAALGVNVAAAKLYAFTLAAGIAGVGGVLLAFLQPSVLVSRFDVFDAIALVGVVVVGGIGSPGGAIIGALLIAGGVTSKIFEGWASFDLYLPLIGGVLLLLNLRFAPNGLFELNRALLAPVTGRVDRLFRRLPVPRRREATGEAAPQIARVAARTLRVRDLSVAFGGVRAIAGVSLEVRPGEVHGLIGPNGAGKTTFIDAVTGFVRAQRGTVELGEVPIHRWPARRRTRKGIARSFQSLELFTDLTVEENLAVACDKASAWRYVTDLVRPGRLRLTPAAHEAIRQFDLDASLHLKPEKLSFGQRKVVAIARSIAGMPSVLLLDEPAAGLDDHEAGELATLIRELARDWGIGVLLVEHKIDMVMSICDRVTVLRGGEVLVSGTPAEVRTDPAVIEAYLGADDDAGRAVAPADS